MLPSEPTSVVDVVVRVETPAQGVLRRLKRVLRQRGVAFRLVVVVDGAPEASFWAKLERLARERAEVLLLRNEQPLGFRASINRALEQTSGHDVVLLEPSVRIFPGFLAKICQIGREDPYTAFVSPLSNEARAALSAEWQAPLAVPAGVSGKQWAKLVERVAPQTRPDLVSPDRACVWMSARVRQVLGAFEPSAAADEMLAEYASRARRSGFKARLADDLFVYSAERAPTASVPPSSGASSVPGLPFAELLGWHTRRGTAKNRSAPLILLDGSPYFGRKAEDTRDVERVVRALAWPRVVLAYPAVGGMEIVEVLRGEWTLPLVYRRELPLPLARFVEDTSEAERALSEVLTLFQVSFVHVHGFELWPKLVQRLSAERRLPCVVTLDEEGLSLLAEEQRVQRAAPPPSGAEPWTELLSNAQRVICSSEAVSTALGAALGIKEKKRRVASAASFAADGAPNEDVVRMVAAAYAGCQARAPSSARRWLSRDDLRRLVELRREPGPLVVTRSQPAPAEPRTPNSWLGRLGARVPSLIRNMADRIPYSRRLRRQSDE